MSDELQKAIHALRHFCLVANIRDMPEVSFKFKDSRDKAYFEAALQNEFKRGLTVDEGKAWCAPERNFEIHGIKIRITNHDQPHKTSEECKKMRSEAYYLKRAADAKFNKELKAARWPKVYEDDGAIKYEKVKIKGDLKISDSYYLRKTDNGIYKRGQVYGHSHSVWNQPLMEIMAKQFAEDFASAFKTVKARQST